MKNIILGGGCFWCLDAQYRKIDGILDVISGYAGGDTENPTYENVCSGKTGHAEVVQVIYDESVITLENILELFFEFHDPTTPNKQGADIGTQYRSIIFYEDATQKEKIESILKIAQENFQQKIVTEIQPFVHFYKAEEYHQNYYFKNPNQPYCLAVISPKLEKLLNSLDLSSYEVLHD
jgi:methionine-S-sulfoxide reductase